MKRFFPPLVPSYIVFTHVSWCGTVEGSVQPALCPVGHYCPLGLTLGWEFPCPPGTVQGQPGASSPEACLLCPAGMELINFSLQIVILCPQLKNLTLMCYLIPLVYPAGMFCSYPGLSQPTGLCQAGFYCPAGSTSPNATAYQVLFSSFSFYSALWFTGHKSLKM